jgi:hypothetical protein
MEYGKNNNNHLNINNSSMYSRINSGIVSNIFKKSVLE